MFRILPSPCCFPRLCMSSRYRAICQQYPGGTLPWFLRWFKQTSCPYAVISWPFTLKPHLLALAYYLFLSCHYHPRLFLAYCQELSAKHAATGSWRDVILVASELHWGRSAGAENWHVTPESCAQLGVTAQQLCPLLKQLPRQHIHTANASNGREERDNLLHFQFVILLKC